MKFSIRDLLLVTVIVAAMVSLPLSSDQ